ncbi:MAG TPA: metalloregulator ArsR/SmtB family transcription factor [Candidatus Nanoarchaeia archaeon]|nr:metalloregulator ArsR/SmtB family transcription factor [Candidatus Nanoarchaeia archaeon]
MGYDLSILKAIADDTRLAILLSLQKSRKSVSELVLIVKKSQPNISIALRKLLQAGLVSPQKEAQHVFYSIKNEQLIDAILELIKHG